MNIMRTSLRRAALIVAMAVNTPALIAGVFCLLLFWPLAILLPILLIVAAAFSGQAMLAGLCLLLGLMNGLLIFFPPGKDGAFSGILAGLLGIGGCLWMSYCIYQPQINPQRRGTGEQRDQSIKEPAPAKEKIPQPSAGPNDLFPKHAEQKGEGPEQSLHPSTRTKRP